MGGSEVQPGPAEAVRSFSQRARIGARRTAIGAAGFALLVLAACAPDDVTARQLPRLGLPDPASDRAPFMHDLWIGTWIAAGAVGVLTWGLILWAALRYRRKHNELPKQNRYNLPMEIMYTFTPFVIVGVLFYFTIVAQDKILAKVPDPDHEIKVVGQKWSWTFNYTEADNPAVRSNVWETGTIDRSPTLYLPVNESVRFTFTSPDVIHDFWVPAFYQKMDVVPGRVNTFDMTPTVEGIFEGKCAELCGTYHSAMLFKVHIVSQAEYNAHLNELKAAGQTGEALGPENANRPNVIGAEAQAEAEQEEGN